MQLFNQTRKSPLGVTLAIALSFSLGVSVNIDASHTSHNSQNINNSGTMTYGDNPVVIGEVNTTIETVTQLITNILEVATDVQTSSSNTDVDTSIIQIQNDADQVLQIITQLQSLECTPVAENPIPSPDRTPISTLYSFIPLPSGSVNRPNNTVPDLRRDRNSTDRDSEGCDADGRVAPNGSKYWICDPNGGNY